MEHAPWARGLARRLLEAPLPIRWSHTQGVGSKAEAIAHIVGDDADLLISAAWLHDIGYSPDLARSGFHPLDGARYLRDVEDANQLLCRLVAHHSCAAVEARNRSLASELTAEFPGVDGLVADALTFCDMTTSPTGEPIKIETRISEILARYGDGDVVAVSIGEARSHLIKSTRNVASAISSTPSDSHESGLRSN
jgi:hypothetical protein